MFTPRLHCSPSFIVCTRGIPRTCSAPPPRWLVAQTGTAFQAYVGVARGTRSRHPRWDPQEHKTVEASRRRSVDGASVKSDRPWRTQATAPPLLGQPPRSPEETVPPSAVLPRCRRKHSSLFCEKASRHQFEILQRCRG